MNIYPAILPKKINKNGKVNIKIRICHKGKVRDVATDFYIDPTCWLKGKVKNHPNEEYINVELGRMVVEYQDRMLKNKNSALPIQRIVSIINDETQSVSDFTTFFGRIIAEKAKINTRTGEIYQATLNKIQKWDKRPVLIWEDISAGWLRKFDVAMSEEGLKNSSKEIHFRNIRTVYNAGIDDGLIKMDLYPFRRFKIRQHEEDYEPLSLEQVKKLATIPYDKTMVEFFRKAWLLSFCTIGMNNHDLYHLKKEDIRGGRVYFNRGKTGKPYSIFLQPQALSLMKDLKGEMNLLCFADRYQTSKIFTHQANKYIKELGKSIGREKLIMYDARHSWSTLAKTLFDCEDSTISYALGHSIEGVTQRYIHRKRSLIDDLNRDLISAVFSVSEIEYQI